MNYLVDDGISMPLAWGFHAIQAVVSCHSVANEISEEFLETS
jgi:hypothetical protein